MLLVPWGCGACGAWDTRQREDGRRTTDDATRRKQRGRTQRQRPIPLPLPLFHSPFPYLVVPFPRSVSLVSTPDTGCCDGDESSGTCEGQWQCSCQFGSFGILSSRSRRTRLVIVSKRNESSKRGKKTKGNERTERERERRQGKLHSQSTMHASTINFPTSACPFSLFRNFTKFVNIVFVYSIWSGKKKRKWKKQALECLIQKQKQKERKK